MYNLFLKNTINTNTIILLYTYNNQFSNKLVI